MRQKPTQTHMDRKSGRQEDLQRDNHKREMNTQTHEKQNGTDTYIILRTEGGQRETERDSERQRGRDRERKREAGLNHRCRHVQKLAEQETRDKVSHRSSCPSDA